MKFEKIEKSPTSVGDRLISICQLVVFVEDRWPRLMTTVRAANIILTLIELHFGLARVVVGEPASVSLWALGLSLLLYGSQAVLVLVEIIWFVVRDRFRR